MKDENFKSLVNYLQKVPSIISPLASGSDDEDYWWVKFQIDIENKYAWQAVQEIGHIVNYISINEKLPTLFFPVSPPPYLNGGPKEFLSWIIEVNDPSFKPIDLLHWFEARMPDLEDLDDWNHDEE